MSKLTTISAAVPQIQSGRLHPRELVEQCLAQIHTHEDRLHAWVEVDEAGARREAESLGREVAEGRYRGPLHGIPVGIKDIIDVAGMPTRAGSPLRANHRATSLSKKGDRHLTTSVLRGIWSASSEPVPLFQQAATTDAPVVAALRQAGAIILGKTVTVEFACFDPSPTRNPWDPTLQHTPGGSSSGSAVAVLMGMCLGALGTQTGGSLVRPSAFCGIATCKPTFGLLSCDGIVPVSYHFDHAGPMARSVADLTLMLRALLGNQPHSHEYCRHPERSEGSRLTSAEILRCAQDDRHGARDDRLGNADSIPRPPRLGWLQDFFIDEADSTILATTTAAIERLRAAGATVEPVATPDDFRQVRAIHRCVMAVEAAAYHRAQFAAHREAYGPMIAELLDEGLAISAVDYADALERQRQFKKRVDAMFEQADVLVCPSTDTTAPATLTTTGIPKFQAPWSCSGAPVVSLPCGLAADGMPASIQLVARRGGDAMLLQVAEWCERSLAFNERPPVLPRM